MIGNKTSQEIGRLFFQREAGAPIVIALFGNGERTEEELVLPRITANVHPHANHLGLEDFQAVQVRIGLVHSGHAMNPERQRTGRHVVYTDALMKKAMDTLVMHDNEICHAVLHFEIVSRKFKHQHNETIINLDRDLMHILKAVTEGLRGMDLTVELAPTTSQDLPPRYYVLFWASQDSTYAFHAEETPLE